MPEWIFCAKREDNLITTHDCYVTGMFREGQDIVWEFANGFKLIPQTAMNPESTFAVTTCAQMRLENCDPLFERIYLFRQRRKTAKRIPISTDDLMNRLNSGRWRLELIEEYHTGNGVLFVGELCTDRRPYRRVECWVSFHFEGDMQYNWNDLTGDKWM